VRDHDTPELIKAVEQGKTSVSAAAAQARPKPKPQPKPEPKPQLPKVDGRLIVPIWTAFRQVEQASTTDMFRRALERLAKAVTNTLEKIDD
jgi:hypothetical protein